jgi:hypothetical protein
MGFKLRSGNGPLAFKNMGSSPAKQSSSFGPSTFGLEKGLLGGKKEGGLVSEENRINPKKDATDLGAKDRKIVAKAPDKKEVPKKHRDQVKKAEKITKLEGKEAKRDAKRADGKKVFLGNLKKKNNANKREKLQTEVDKTSEQYVADKAAKKESDRRRASEIMIGISKNFDPNSQFKSLAEQEAQSSTTKRRNQNIEDYETGKNKELELDNEPSNKTNTDGTAKITRSTAQKVDDEKAVEAGTKVKNSDGTYSPSSPAEYKRKK